MDIVGHINIKNLVLVGQYGLSYLQNW